MYSFCQEEERKRCALKGSRPSRARSAWPNLRGGPGSLGSAEKSGPPIVLSSSPDILLAQGSPITLRIAAAGTRPMNFQWSLEGQSIPAATNSWFEISSTELRDAGLYGASIRNDLGQQT